MSLRRCVECGFVDPPDYCPACGTKRDATPLKLVDLLRQPFEVDAPLIHTARDLLWKPGRVAEDWIRGRRLAYTSPLRFCLVMSVGAALVLGAVADFNSLAGSERAFAELAMAYLGFLALLLAFPLAWSARLVGAMFSHPMTWLEWVVVCTYAFGIAIPVQVVLSIVGLGALGGLAPIGWFCLASWQVARGTVEAVVICVAATTLWIAALAGIIALAERGAVIALFENLS